MIAARTMRRLGRRAGYTIGALVAIAGALLAWYAMSSGACAAGGATFVTGAYNAFGASYRFAAADVADAYRPSFRSRAISLVLAGGIVGGVIGPEISKLTRTALPTLFRARTCRWWRSRSRRCCSPSCFGCPRAPPRAAQGPVRPLCEILAQPACWVAILSRRWPTG